eukprot:12262662-Ditylum_brightwellii.AAC.1
MQPESAHENAQFIHELTQRMDAVEENLGKQPVDTGDALEDQKVLLKEIMERTKRLDAKTPTEESPAMTKLREETKKLEEQQKEYQD